MAAVAHRAARRAQRGDGVARRRRLRPVRLLRLGHRHSHVRPPRRRRRALQQLPHDRAVLADARLPADRAQPPRQRDGPHRRVRLGLPRLRRLDAQGQRVPVRGARPQRVRHVRRRQVAPRTRARDGARGDARAVAARARLRALLRVPRRRDRPVPPGPRARQPPGRPAALAGRGLPPQRGPRRPGHRLREGPARLLAGPAVLPLLRARRLPRPAPGAAAPIGTATAAASTTAGIAGGRRCSPASKEPACCRRAPH